MADTFFEKFTSFAKVFFFFFFLDCTFRTLIGWVDKLRKHGSEVASRKHPHFQPHPQERLAQSLYACSGKSSDISVLCEYFASCESWIHFRITEFMGIAAAPPLLCIIRENKEKLLMDRKFVFLNFFTREKKHDSHTQTLLLHRMYSRTCSQFQIASIKCLQIWSFARILTGSKSAMVKLLPSFIV